jgi:hypothetical protein
MYYKVQISKDENFSTLVVNKIVRDEFIQDPTQYHVGKELEYFQEYYW